MGYNEKAFALGSRRSIIREIFEYSICGCSHSSKIRISLKGRFFGIFWLIVAHRRQPYVLRFTKISTKKRTFQVVEFCDQRIFW